MKNANRVLIAALSVSLTLTALKVHAQAAPTIANVLATSQLGANKALIQSLYAQRGNAPIFFANGVATPLAQELRTVVMTVAPLHGLHASDYWSADLDAALAGPLDAQSALNAEAKLAKVYVDLATHVSVGRLIPTSISSDIKYAKQPFDATALAAGVSGEGITQVINRVAPQHDLYRKQMQILARLLQIKAQGGFKGLTAPAKTLQLGVSSPVVTDIKSRLAQLGYAITNTSPVFDQELDAAMKDVQRNNLTDPTGVLHQASTSTWEYFSNSLDSRVLQVEMNLEKLRWLPNKLEPRHIFVNLAIQHLYLTDPNLAPQFDSLRDMLVINGRKERKTPSMRDETKKVILNPTWGVPTTVFREDKVPMIRDILQKQGQWGLSDWFTQKRFTVMDNSFTKYIDPLSIDWINLNAKDANFYIVQQPGWDNALGVAKVLLGNPWSIYMHDTNERNLFVSNLRALSSGCMRMSKPIDMVEYLLQGTEWPRQRIDDFVAKEGETRDKETWVNIPVQNKLSVYTLPITANLGDDGVIRFTRDLYSQNSDVYRALQRAGFYKTAVAAVR
jgi:murein L,D-transpeptidase YcbB/YkuD